MCDLDGTLVDTSQDLWRALNHVLLQRHLPPLAHAEVRDMVGNGARALVARGLWGNGATAPEGDAAFETAVADFLDHYRAHLADHSRPYPGVVATLERLRGAGVGLAIITNKPEEMSVRLLAALGLAGHFRVIVGGDSLPRRKPDPLPVRHVLEQLACPVEAALLVGDSVTDVDTARAAGCRVVAVSYGYNQGLPVEQLAPDRVVHCFEDLIPLIMS